MPEIDDIQLLHEFAQRGSDAAFAEIVRRHVNLVFSVALRRTGNHHHAEDITQAVFIILARKAGSLGRKTILSGWLYQTARLAAANFLRTERRRAFREKEVYMQSQLNEPEPDVWPQIAPLLEDAMAKLSGKDRDVLVLRFFQGKSLHEVGKQMGATEDAAKMRTARALERLRQLFVKRGVTLSATLIAGAVAANSVQGAPASLAFTVTGTAAKGTTIATSIAALVKGTMKTMTWLKMKFAITSGSAIVVAVVTTSVVLADNTPTEVQLRQLFDSVARVFPSKMRVVSLHTLEEEPPGKAEIQRVADAWRRMQERIQEGAPEPQRTQRIEDNVRLRLSAMTGKHYEKIQEWKSGSLYRQDCATGWQSLEEAALKTNYDITTINLVDPTSGATSTREINYDVKSFRKCEGGSLYTEIGAWRGMGVEDPVEFVVASALASNESIRQKAKDERQKLALDEEKLRRILSGQDPGFKVSVAEKQADGRPYLVFEFKAASKSKTNTAATVLIECEKTHFNRITRTEVKSSGGKTQLSSLRAEFDARDFPHQYRLVENGEDGYTTNYFSIGEVDLDANFSDDEVFRVEPARDFGVVVDAPGRKPVVESYPDGVKPQRTVDVSDILAGLNSKNTGHIWLLALVAATVLIPIFTFAVWRYSQKAKHPGSHR